MLGAGDWLAMRDDFALKLGGIMESLGTDQRYECIYVDKTKAWKCATKCHKRASGQLYHLNPATLPVVLRPTTCATDSNHDTYLTMCMYTGDSQFYFIQNLSR